LGLSIHGPESAEKIKENKNKKSTSGRRYREIYSW
jgi:hypothetical protein